MKNYLMIAVLCAGSMNALNVSITNKTNAPLSAMVQNDDSSRIIIEAGKTGFVNVDRDDQKVIELSQAYESSMLGGFTLKGSIPMLNLTNYSFIIVRGRANELNAIATEAAVTPNIQGAGIKGML